MGSTLRISDPGDEALLARIRDRIREKGRITFAEFMETALYDPDHGYYTSGREPVGTRGDYLTGPEMHPAFGAMIARWVAGRWREMGSPSPFDVVEIGAGTGLLHAAIAAYLEKFEPELQRTLHYRAVEIRGVRSQSGESAIEVLESLAHIPDGSITGCIVSNELVDAFPVHVVVVEGRDLREIYVAWDGERFVEVTGEPSTPQIPSYFDRLGIVLPEGYRTEVNLEALGWIRQVAAKLSRGYVLTIDYGYTADEYYSPERRRGTLLCYYRHTSSEDPYVRVGQQDITAHVDFTSLMEAGRKAGLEVVQFTTQRDFLLAQGIREWLERANPRERRAILSLIDPRGMGGFKQLVQKK